MEEQQIQNNYNQNVCKGFLLYCKHHRINITSKLNTRGKITRQSVYAVSKGKVKYLPFIALCYLAAKLDFKSPSILEQYYLNSQSN
jgi:hypothetical protein